MNVFSEKVNKMNLQMIRECRVALNTLDDDRYSARMRNVHLESKIQKLKLR